MAVSRLVVPVAALAALIVVGPTAVRASSPPTIVQLTGAAACTAPARLAAAGGTQIDAQLRLWRVPTRLLPGLRARGAIAASQQARTYTVARSTVTPDPLEAQETWRQQIGIDGLTPPGPGIPITIVDSGVDFAHPEFAGRPDLVALNSQEPIGVGRPVLEGLIETRPAATEGRRERQLGEAPDRRRCQNGIHQFKERVARRTETVVEVLTESL